MCWKYSEKILMVRSEQNATWSCGHTHTRSRVIMLMASWIFLTRYFLMYSNCCTAFSTEILHIYIYIYMHWVTLILHVFTHLSLLITCACIIQSWCSCTINHFFRESCGATAHTEVTWSEPTVQCTATDSAADEEYLISLHTYKRLAVGSILLL